MDTLDHMKGLIEKDIGHSKEQQALFCTVWNFTPNKDIALEFRPADTMDMVEAKIARERADVLISGRLQLGSTESSHVQSSMGQSESMTSGTLGCCFLAMERAGDLPLIEEEEEVDQKLPKPPFVLVLRIRLKAS